MKKILQLFFVLVMLTHNALVFANLPMASAWNLGKNPDGSPIISPLLTEWQSDTDPNYIFYKDLPDVSPSFALNTNVSKFVPLIGFKTLETPAQFIPGTNDIGHLYTQWSSTPIYVDFGGSQSEGQVLAPPPGLIRAAHKNGAKILGSIFLSPPVYGGDKEIEWVKAMVTPSPDGSYLHADQLIKIARAYHFDGYFINQEAILYDETMDRKFVDFIHYFHAKAPDLLIDWYQVPAYSASPKFLQPGTEVFLDYGASMSKWAQTAKTANFPIENIEYGVNGIYTYTLDREMYYLQETYKNQLSIGQFAAERITLHNSDQSPAPDLKTALDRIDVFFNGNVNLQGVNAFVQQRSAITQLPFFTDFNVGQGTEFFVNGQKTNLGKWTSAELQGILPTLAHDTLFSAYYDLTNAYNGGSSLSVTIAPHETLAKYTLFQTQLNLAAKSILKIVYQNEGKQADKLCVSYANGDENCFALTETNQWQSSELLLDEYPKTITTITLQSAINKTSHTIHIGQIYIGEPSITPKAHVDFQYTSHLGKHFIEWQRPAGTAYFDIYQVIDDQESFVARTYNTFYCIDDYPPAEYRIDGSRLDDV